MTYFYVDQIIELPDHPFYVGAQFHPEFKSRPGNPSPLFVGAYSAICGTVSQIKFMREECLLLSLT